MNLKIKSGKEIIADFFGNIKSLAGVDANIADVFSNLYYEDKLTNTNITNALLKLRDADGGNKN